MSNDVRCRPRTIVHKLPLDFHSIIALRLVFCVLPSCGPTVLPSYVMRFLPSYVLKPCACHSTSCVLSFCRLAFPFDVRLISVQPLSGLRSTSVWFSFDVRLLLVIPNDTPYSSNYTLCWNFVGRVLYYCKILGHGTTPCPRMMRALSLIQSQDISYEVTHNPLNQYLWVHDLSDGTMKHL
jgi:hypothetical protein